MNNNFPKFIFLAAVVGAVLFSRMAYPAAAPAAPAEGMAETGGEVKVPLFAMPQSSVSAESGGESAAASSDKEANGAAGTWTGPNGALVFARMNDTQAPVLDAHASLVADLTTGTVFESDHADRRWPTASVAKLMSATIVLDKLDPGSRVYITDAMFSVDPTEPVLAVGGTYTVLDLLKLMLLPSSNVAAEAAASFYGLDAFLKEMNARAAAWGMEDTYYTDPSGLSSSDQSTANDLLKLAQRIYKDYPKILATSRTPQATITEMHSGAKSTIQSINLFAGTANFIGGKTGHTDEAEGNLVSVFQYENRPILIIVLGTNNRFEDTKSLYNWFTTSFK